MKKGKKSPIEDERKEEVQRLPTHWNSKKHISPVSLLL